MRTQGGGVVVCGRAAAVTSIEREQVTNLLVLTGYAHGIKMVKNGVCQFTLMFEVKGKRTGDRPFLRCVLFSPKGKSFFDHVRNGDRVIISGSLDGDVDIETGTGFKKVHYQCKVDDWDKTIRREESYDHTQPLTTKSENPNLPATVSDEAMDWIE
jgi:single-stranded DNA-binding protein